MKRHALIVRHHHCRRDCRCGWPADGAGAEGLPVVLLRGLALPQANGQVRDLVRPKELDLYR